MGDATSGGGVDTDVGGAGQDTGGGRDTSPSTPASLGFGGARGDIVARDTTPAPNVQPSFTYEAPVITTDPERDFGRSGLFSFFTPKIDAAMSYSDPGQFSRPLGSGPVNQFTQGLASLTGGGGGAGDGPSFGAQESSGYQPDPTTYANVPESINQTRIRDLYRQDSPSLGGARFGSPEQQAYGSGRMFPANVGFTSPSAPTVDQTSPSAPTVDQTSPLDFVFDYGFGTAGSPQSPEDFRREEEKIASMTGGARNIIDPLQTLYQRGFTPGEDIGALYGRGFDPTLGEGALTQAALPAARPAVIDTQPKTDANAAAAKLAALARSGGAKTKEELNLVQRFGRFLQGLGKGISNFQMSDIFEFLKGDPNFKGPSPAQQQLMGVPGPGPFVGGGAPSPSGGGGMPMPAKDPCPPGFRFDPTLQQCVPIIAPNTPTDTTTTPTTPTTPAPGTSPPAAGGIADAYPFVLTPPIGTPVGNLPPVRLTT